ncbi:FkbM family methyltransferase [Paenibacillus sp. MBLB2552]|uniref:FkbM family methyltransferase n=1 Tax=Paenibacillus mellifer TaxID=2937794 RepID=A0A9X2BQD6_9BACL|nr:FkbM family methyltransferase [Paenibacillus mellifer]MCK8489019.1 FkbM family methyltransferase [Paenibacillus mellifer]
MNRFDDNENNELKLLISEMINNPNNYDLLNDCVRVALAIEISAEAFSETISLMAGGFMTEEILNNLGITFWQQNQFDYVIPLLQKSLDINPSYTDALFNLGYVLNQVGENQLAMDYLQKINPPTPEAVELIGKIRQLTQPSFFAEYEVEVTQAPGIQFPLYVRMNTSDPAVFRQIFERKDYAFGLPITPKLIIDGGANVGYGSVFFANMYPAAQVIAIEPEKSNFEVLSYNVAPYKQIKTVQSGLWHTDTYLKVMDVGLDKWGAMVEEVETAGPETIQAVTIGSLLKNSDFDEIDILKLDIEGAEREVFSLGYEEWLDKVNVLIIELHDVMKRGCSKAFFKAVSQYDFATFARGENLVLVKETLLYK